MTEVGVSLDVEVFGQPLTLIAETGGEETTLSVEVKDPPSLAEIIESFARPIVPGFELRVPPPWDALVDFKPPPFTLTVGSETVGLKVDETVTIVDGILDVSSIELVYNSDDEELAITLGVTLLGEDLDGITWDPIEEPVPAVDTETARTFELEYLGLGQRMAPAGPTPETIGAAMDLLMGPNDEASSDQPSKLRFDADAGWFFGTRFSAMDTVDLDLIFWDPHLYGLVVKLRGEQAGSLDGLRFEILYRKINEHLGVYHADIELPTVLRRVELGAASLTLPAAVIDIYTDGSFLIDLGFPHDLDFSRSASVEIFPFVGQGGVYFGKLPTEAVPQLPAVTEHARFGPVIAVGLGVNVGVGKTIEMGALSAGATVTMSGIFEGVIAPYIDAAGSQAGLYYRVTAHVGLIGHIYGTVNFGIVQAQVDIMAMASVSVTIEAHRAAIVLLQASVSVQLEIRVLFVTLYFSFEASVRAEFTIGENTTAPWDLPSGGGPLLLGAAGSSSPIDEADLPAFTMVAPRPRPEADRIKIPLTFVPQVTIGTDGSGAPTVAVTCMLMVDMTVPESGQSDFGRLVDACFSWAVDMIGGESPIDDDTELNRAGLARLQRQLGGSRTEFSDRTTIEPEHRLTPKAVLDFWEQNFSHTLVRWTEAAAGAATRHAFFPMNPTHRFEVSQGETLIHGVDFSKSKPCSPAYRRWLEDWFAELRVVSDAESATEQPLMANASTGDDDDPTLAALLKVDYYRTILRVAVGDALAAFDSLPYRPAADDTLGSLAARFGEEAVLNMVLIEPSDMAVQAVSLDIPTGSGFALPIEADPLDAVIQDLGTHGVHVELRNIVALNLDRADLLVAGENIDWPPVSTDDEPTRDAGGDAGTQIVVSQNDTLGSIVDRLPGTTLSPEPPTDEERIDRAVALITEMPGLVRTGASILLPTISGYSPEAGQSIAAIAETFGLDPADLLTENAGATPGTPLHIPGCDRLTVGDVRQAFTELGTVDTSGAAVTRYFLHGLRLPDPDEFDGAGFSDADADSDSGPALKPLFELLGQQINVPPNSDAPSDPSDPADESVEAGSVGSWTFELGSPNGMAVVTPEAVAELGAAADSYQQLLGGQADLALENSLASITEDRPFVNQVSQFTLDQPAAWTRPTNDDEPPLFHLATLSDSIRALLDRPTVIEVRSDVEGEPLTTQRISRFDFAARAVAAPSGTSRYTPGLYELGATDPKAQADLLASLDELGPEDRVVIAYADPTGGMRTDDVDSETTALVRTNLSTVTKPSDRSMMLGDAGDDSESEPTEPPPTLANAVRFLEVLWQGSVVNRRGLYLDYRLADGAGDSGLDVALGADGRGTISFLILWDESETQAFEQRHNCLAVPFQSADARLIVTPARHRAPDESRPLTEAGSYGDIDLIEFVQANATTPNIIVPGHEIVVGDTSYTPFADDDLLLIALRLGITLEELAADVVAAQIHIAGGASVNVHPRWVVKRSTAAPGMLSLLATRPDQPHGQGGSVEQLVATYNLLGFEVLETDSFAGSAPGLPLSPQTTSKPDESGDSDIGQLVYRRAVPIAALVKDGSPEDPYAAVGLTAHLGFHLVDLFGNRSRELKQLAVDIRYRDPVIGVEAWPGVDATYAIDPDDRTLDVSFAVDIGRLINMSTTTPERWESRLAQDRAGLANAARQLSDERLVASLRSGLDPDVTHPIDRAVLQTAIAETAGWVEAVAELQTLEITRNERASTSLSTVADEYQVSALAIAAANLDNEKLLRRGAKLTIPGADGASRVEVAVEAGQTLAEIARRHRVAVEDLVAANADEKLVAAKASYSVPLHHLPPADATGERWHRVTGRSGGRDLLGTIAEKFGISIESLIEANLTMHNILLPGRPIRLPSEKPGQPGEVGGSVWEIDTLGALLGRLERETGATIDPTELAKANEPGRSKEGFRLRPGAVLLIPPKPVSPDPVPFAVGTAEDLAPLRVELTLERPAALVDPHLRSSPEVWRIASEIAPALPSIAVDGSDPDGTKRLTPLAKDLATAIPGWQLGRESRPHYGAGRKDVLIAVRDVPLTLKPAAAFYRPKPLATEPWRVAIGEEGNARVQTVDLNHWNDRCLALIEVALGALVAPRLAGLDRAAFDAVMAAKASLAGSISRRTESIIADPERDDADRESGRTAAAEVIHQRLLRRLDNLGRAGCVIDYRRDVDDFNDRPSTTPRRLFGRTVALDATFDKTRPVPQIRPGEAKVEFGGEAGTGLTFEVDIAAEPGMVSASLEWHPIGVEYDIGDGIGDYERSRWITFIVPPTPLLLGTPNVPVPSSDLPDGPTLVRDGLVTAKLGSSLVDRRTYAYELDVRFSGDPNDRPELALLVNEATGSDELRKPVADGGDLATLAEVLARFVADEERLLTDLTAEDDAAAAAVGDLARHASDLAAEWLEIQPPPADGGLMMSAIPTAEEVDGHDADEPLLISASETDSDDVLTATSRPLDALAANVVAGEVTVVRNEHLVDGRATSPGFILRSHPSRLPIGQRFATRIEDEIDVRTLHGEYESAPTIGRRVSAALSILAGQGQASASGVPRPPLDIEIEALVELGPTDLAFRTPIGLWPRRRFSSELGSAIEAELASHMPDVGTAGRWVLRVRVFASSAPAGAGPIIEYSRVVIPMDSVTRP